MKSPWRFKVGNVVYVAGHPQQPARVTAAFGHGGFAWPHYLIVDAFGAEWRVCQLHLSSSVIRSRP